MTYYPVHTHQGYALRKTLCRQSSVLNAKLLYNTNEQKLTDNGADTVGIASNRLCRKKLRFYVHFLKYFPSSKVVINDHLILRLLLAYASLSSKLVVIGHNLSYCFLHRQKYRVDVLSILYSMLFRPYYFEFLEGYFLLILEKHRFLIYKKLPEVCIPLLETKLNILNRYTTFEGTRNGPE